MKEQITLIEKYLTDQITPEEKKELEAWIKEDPSHMSLFSEHVEAYDPNIDFDLRDGFRKFITTTETLHRKQKMQRLYKYAAVFVGVLCIGFLSKVWLSPEQTTSNVVSTEKSTTDKLALEGKIVLTLADGTQKIIQIDDQTEIKDTEGNLIAHKNADGMTLFSEDAKNTHLHQYGEIRIPYGEKFKIQLSDGTVVWLNAGSSLRFPERFNPNAKHRLVYLEGEAFFDVTSNKKQPFIVNTQGMDIKVLGTQFNLSSYSADQAIVTTLVEGSVQVYKTNAPKNAMVLTPDHQAIYSKDNNTLHKAKVDTSPYTSWIHGRLIVHDMKFETLLKKLERMHNVTIVNTYTKLNTEIYKGEFNNENIETILQIISASAPFQYTIENGVITIRE